jgi:hypothetical protein
VDSASIFSATLAESILSGLPFLSALLAALLANTPDPTHSFLLSTLTAPGQAYVLFLAFPVRTRRAGPSLLRSASARRTGRSGRGTCPRLAARAPPRPAPKAPRARAGPLSTSWRAWPRRPRTQSRSSRRCRGPAGHGSTRHVTPPPAARARARAGRCVARRRGSRDTTTRGDPRGDVLLRSRSPAPAPLFASTPQTRWSRLDASHDPTAVRRAHGPGWARCAACRRESRDTTTGGERGDTVLRSCFLPTALVTVVECSEGGRGSRPLLSSWTALGAANSANSYTIPCGINRCRRLKFPTGLFVSRLPESADRVDSRLSL